jgi:YD repeat-containing protein
MGKWWQQPDRRWHLRVGLITLLVWTLVCPAALFAPREARAAYVDAPSTQLPPVPDASAHLAVGDLDGDGAPDVVVANHGQSRLLRNDGSGTLVDETATRLPTLDTVTTAVALGDVDGDGALDLLLADARGPNRLLRNDGSGTFVDETITRLPSQHQASLGLALGDVDGDTDLDLVVANWNSQNRLFLNDGSGVFTEGTAGRLPVESDPSVAVVVDDVDANGTRDLVVANHNAPSRLLLNNGLGVFTDVSATHLPASVGELLDATLADVDRDGDPDLLLAAGAAGLWLWLNTGSGVLTDVSATHLPVLDAFGLAVAVGDVDEDSTLDVVVAAAGQDRVLVNDGTGQFSDATASLLPVDTRRSVALALADADGDLDLDLLLATPGAANRMLLNVLTFPCLRLVASPAVVDLGNPVTLSINAFDEDGLMSATLTLTDPVGGETEVDLTGDLADGSATHLTTPTLTGTYTVTVNATDTGGTTHSRSVPYTVLPPDVSAPQVTVAVETPAPILVGQPVSLRVTATDDRGLVQTTLTVNGAAVPLASDGTATTVPTTTGPHAVVATASDAAGNTGTAASSFTVQADLEAPLVSVNVTPSPIPLTQAIAITVTATDNVAVTTQSLRVTGPAIPDGLDLALDDTSQAIYTPFHPGTYTLTATAWDPSGHTGTGTTSFEAWGVPDTTAPVVTLTVTPPTVALGGSVALRVTATDDVGVTTTTLEINDTPVSLDATGQATSTPPVLGDYTAMATAQDAFGNIGTDTVTFRAVDPAADTTPPLVSITTPADDAEVTAPTTIIGTVQDETLISYTLEVSPHDTNQFTTLATGTAEVFGGVLGTFDPTLLRNDLYDIRLTAHDINGLTSAALVVYQVTGDLKVGHFALTLEDLTIPVAGMPISIRRTYDSRDTTVGDFGVGWHLDIQTTKVRENRVPGTDWEQGKINTFTYCVQPVGHHYVAITLPDGQTETFDVTLNPSCQTLFPVQETTISFTARPGTSSTLEAVTDNVALVVGSPGVGVGTYAPVELISVDDAGHYDPTRYRLTTAEGFVFALDQTFGVQTVTDPNGNTLTFTANGILHSAGKSVIFSRDAQGRITTITDPAGNTIQYGYDAAGNLVSVTDREDHVTTYNYNNNHGLLLSQHADTALVLNVYDDDGRLLSTTNGAGRTITFGHNLDTRQEVVTDTDGSITVVEYDAQGHIVRTTDPLGGVTTHTYDDDGHQTSTTNALGHTTTRTFDARGNTLTETDALGHTIRFTYDNANRVLTRIDPNGHTTTFTYDAAGNLLSRVNALGITEAMYIYDAQGNRQTVTDAIGRTITYTYDSAGQPTVVVDPLGNRR